MGTKFIMSPNSFSATTNEIGVVDMTPWMDLIIAVSKGQIIQGRLSSGKWRDMNQVSFTDSVDIYRVKPESISGSGEAIVWVNPNNKQAGFSTFPTPLYCVKVTMKYEWEEIIE